MTWLTRLQGSQPTPPAGIGSRPAPGMAPICVDVTDLLRLTGASSKRPASAGSLDTCRRGLSKGSSGDDVRELQQNLRTLGLFKYPTDTAYFGEETEKAVAIFKQQHSADANGVADAITLEQVAKAAAARPAAPLAGHASEIQVDADIRPRSHSTIPGHQGHVEQGNEFVHRYFTAQGKEYPTPGQPYSFLMSGRDARGVAKPQFERNFNGGASAPAAGDILVAKGSKAGEYHTALVTKVEGGHVTVLQANMPKNWQTGRELSATFKLETKDGRYTMPALPTSQKGFGDDYAVVGWIHPTGKDALPQK